MSTFCGLQYRSNKNSTGIINFSKTTKDRCKNISYKNNHKTMANRKIREYQGVIFKITKLLRLFWRTATSLSWKYYRQIEHRRLCKQPNFQRLGSLAFRKCLLIIHRESPCIYSHYLTKMTINETYLSVGHWFLLLK